MSSSVPPTIEEVKEWCIEWATESGHKSSFALHLHPEYLTNLCMLDSELVEEMDLQMPTAIGLDMETALNDTVERSKKALYPGEMSESLLENLNPEVIEMKNKVEKLLDEELESYNTGELGKNMSFLDKAGAIARERAITRFMGASPSRAKEHKHDKFQVCLKRLIGGHGGSCSTEDLAFGYNAPFDEFLRVLQEATVLCTIPPVDFTLEPVEIQESTQPTSHYPSFRDINPLPKSRFRTLGAAGSSNPDQLSSDTDALSPKADDGLPEVEQEYNGAINHTCQRRRTRSQRGYTLDDGPWIHRIINKPQAGQSSQQNPPREFPKSDIKDDKDYSKMLETLKEANKQEGEEYILSIMHSQEYDIQTKWQNKEKQEELEDQLEREKWREENGIEEGDDDDLGEPWMRWWIRTTGCGGSL
ncbi:uncharacterized protein BP5553_07526 [Venustampulla echinocandica]|uniref:Uncharacterized protein n=1 Tax=Venustampulla echinocandica TaxID=2656787 RepID=A0A370TGS6_9HELO|nr:uncharacterized protein BP5553_07526 [Venustampulla echinocandica]RDL34398.1 hypothetical protein BP5553_07526 [Venustampulla echinocandica]